MTIIALCKVLLLGCGGALGYYFFVSYVFLHFPMPFFLGASTLLEGQILQREVAQKKSQHFWWRFGKGVLNGLLVLVWWMVFGGFAYLLYFALDFYFPEAGPLFWPYFGIALALPAVWVLVRSVLFFRKKPVEILVIPEDTRPLIEQVAKPTAPFPAILLDTADLPKESAVKEPKK